MSIVSTNIPYNSTILRQDLNLLLRTYPFLNVQNIGNSVLGNPLYIIKLGRGSKKVFYSASIHANEWITTSILMKFIEDYCILIFITIPFATFLILLLFILCLW